MRIFKISTLLIFTSLITVSCVEKSNKYQALLEERDSLQSKTQNLEQNYNETIAILNEVEAGFATIRQNEGAIISKMGIDSEIQGTTSKQQISQQLTQIKNILDENRKKIATLQKQANKNRKLSETIKLMEEENIKREEAFAVLEAELEKRNIRINELTANIDSLSIDINALNEDNQSQRTLISQQDTNLNTVWYCAGTGNELKELGIAKSSTSLSKYVIENGFDLSMFKKSDLRRLKSIEYKTKKIKLLTFHPKDSYDLISNKTEASVSLVINNPKKFWSVSRYLVVVK